MHFVIMTNLIIMNSIFTICFLANITLCMRFASRYTATVSDFCIYFRTLIALIPMVCIITAQYGIIMVDMPRCGFYNICTNDTNNRFILGCICFVRRMFHNFVFIATNTDMVMPGDITDILRTVIMSEFFTVCIMTNITYSSCGASSRPSDMR